MDPQGHVISQTGMKSLPHHFNNIRALSFRPPNEIVQAELSPPGLGYWGGCYDSLIDASWFIHGYHPWSQHFKLMIGKLEDEFHFGSREWSSYSWHMVHGRWFLCLAYCYDSPLYGSHRFPSKLSSRAFSASWKQILNVVTLQRESCPQNARNI